MTAPRTYTLLDTLARRLSPVLALTLALPAAAQTANTSTSSDASSSPPPGSDSTIVLSPFEVSASKPNGYLTQNTLAGTRLNNNIADLPSSITIVTKQQLEDTASFNLNDVFRYEANTEGASTYTPFTLVRSNLSDSLGGGGGTSGNYTSAATSGNRVRGLSAVDQEEDNFFSLNRIPFDSYNTDAVEILRGPNSIIFGTGSPAGIVNQERSQANPNADRVSGDISLSYKSWGGFRESLSANVPIVKNRFGIYVGQLYNSEGFEQKPSADITRRQYIAATLYPFKNQKTKITGSIERYSNYANDPNGVTPLDFVSPWIKSGEPVWNPVTDQISYLSSSAAGGTYALSAAYPNYSAPRTQALLTTAASPYFVPSLAFVAATHNVMFVDQGNLENFFRASQTGYSVPGYIPALAAQTTANKYVNQERMTLSAALPNPANYATWYNPGVTSKDIYDWSDINVNSLNNTSTRATTYNLNVQQEILPNLNAQVAYFRQDLKQLQDAPLSQASATTLYVDTNTLLPDGRPNPHLGQPFVDVYSSDVYSEPEVNTNWRAMLDWEPDFRQHVPSWLTWIGHHRFLGIFTRHDDVQTNLRYRPAIDGGDANFLPTAATLNNPTGYSYAVSNAAIEQWFYMGGANTAKPGYATSSPGSYNRPGYGGATSANVESYNYATNTWGNSTVNMDSLLFNSGGVSENLQNSKTFFWQSFFWDDRIVGSIGVNQDTVKNRNTVFPASNPLATLYTNGFANTKYWYTYGPWTEVKGTTHTTGVVVHPFKDWSGIDHAAQSGNYLAGLLRSMSFTANRSDNFNPPSANFTDYFGKSLGKSEGKEKDFGLEIATPDNKFFLRATWFHTTNENALVTLTSTARANYIDQTELKNWATKVVEIRNGQNPTTDPNFGNTNIYPITAAMQSQIADLTGLPYTYGGNVGATGEYVNPAATESGIAKGVELEATYSPLRNWTMKLTWAKQQTTISGAAAQAQAWVTSRFDTWKKYQATDLNPAGYTLVDGTKMYLNNFWASYGFDSNIRTDNANGWTSTEAYYNSVVGSQLAIDEANNGTLAPNEREYSWSYLSNYTIDRGPLKRLSFGGALRYSGQAVAGYYGDTTHLNSTNQIAAPDISRPIYTPGKYHLDLWLAYSVKMPWVRNSMMKFQFNVSDVTSNGYLLPVTYNMDGTPAAQRIIAPRTYTLSAKYEF